MTMTSMLNHDDDDDANSNDGVSGMACNNNTAPKIFTLPKFLKVHQKIAEWDGWKYSHNFSKEN